MERPRAGGQTARMNRGHSLLELLFVLTLIGTVLGLVIPSAAHVIDRAVVSAARETFISAVARTRTRAVEAGGAELVVVPRHRLVRIRDARRTEDYNLAEGHRLALSVRPGGDSLRLRFDRMAVGRFTSASIVFRSGDVERSVVISSYGRVRRR